MKVNEYLDSVIGKPWVDRARGPDAFDCMGIFIDFHEKIYNRIIYIPGYATGEVDVAQGFKQQTEEGIFIPVDEPADGILFTAFVDNTPTHLGLVIGNMCLHALGNEKHGGQVRYQRLMVLKRYYDRFEYLKYVG